MDNLLKCSPWFLRQDLSLNLQHAGRVALGWVTLQSLCPQLWDDISVPDFSTWLWGLVSVSHACAASTLLKEPSPEPLISIILVTH